MQLKTKDFDEEPPFTLVIMRADVPESPPPRVSHILIATTAPGSSSSSRHHSTTMSYPLREIPLRVAR